MHALQQVLVPPLVHSQLVAQLVLLKLKLMPPLLTVTAQLLPLATSKELQDQLLLALL